MTNALYTVTPGQTQPPLASDINQLINLLNGLVDAGVLQLAAPISAPSITGVTATAAAGTALGVGAYRYQLTYVVGVKKSDNTVTLGSETTPSTAVAATTTAGNQSVLLGSLPTVWPTTAVALRIYRTPLSGADGTQKLVTTITTPVATYTDTTADAALGAAVPTTNTTGTKFGDVVFNGLLTLNSGHIIPQSGIDVGFTNGTNTVWLFRINEPTGAAYTKNNILDDGSGKVNAVNTVTVNMGSTNSYALVLAGSSAGLGSGIELVNTTPTTGRSFNLYSGSDGALHLFDVTASAERFKIDGTGAITMPGSITYQGTVLPQLRSTNGYVEWNNGGTWQGVGGVKNVQRGSVTAATGVTTNVTITSVNMAKAFVTFTNLMNPGGATQQVTISAFLANATTLSIVNNMPVAYTVYWEVVESY